MEAQGEARQGGSGETKRPSKTEVFEVLSNKRRRYAFHYLKRERREVFVRELAEQVAAWENEKPVEGLTSRERKRVKTALQQHHLPRMADSGFLEYDRQRGTAELSERVADLEVYLDVVPGRDVPWGPVYLGLAAIAGAVVAGAAADIGPLAAVGELTVSAFAVTCVGVIATAHTYLTYAQLRLGGEDGPPEVEQE
jgi:hypothetical protein